MIYVKSTCLLFYFYNLSSRLWAYLCLNSLLRFVRQAADDSWVWSGDNSNRRGRATKQGPWLPGQARPCQLHRGLQCSRALGRGRLAPDQLPQWILFLSLAFSYRKAEQRWSLLLNSFGLSCHCGSAALSDCFSDDAKWHSFANICAKLHTIYFRNISREITLIHFHCKNDCFIKKCYFFTFCTRGCSSDGMFSTSIIRQRSNERSK